MHVTEEDRIKRLIQRLNDCIDDERITWKEAINMPKCYVADNGEYEMRLYMEIPVGYRLEISDYNTGRLLISYDEQATDATPLLAILHDAVSARDSKDAVTELLKYLEEA